jgi:hypothetical protein
VQDDSLNGIPRSPPGGNPVRRFWDSLCRFWWPQVLPGHEVILYSRTGCHLCDDAWDRLQAAQRRYGFALRRTDIDRDPDLAAAYGSCVPVVQVNGKVRFRGGVAPRLLDRLLRAEAARVAAKPARAGASR